MRVAVLANVFPGLSQTFVIEQVVGLLRRGVDVTVFAGQPADVGAVHDVVHEHGLLERTRYWPRRRDPRMPTLSRVARQLAVAPLQLPRLALSTARLGLPRLDAAELFAHATTFLGTPTYDAVLCHFGPLGIKALRLRQLGVLRGPIATVFHGHDVSRYVDAHGTGVYDDLFKHTEQVLPISHYWADKLCGLGCPRQKVRVHRMGVATQTIPYREPQQTGAPVFLAVGRCVEKKGFEYALRGFARLLQPHPKAQLHLVGDGPLRAELEALSRSLGLESHVHFHGYLNQTQVQALREQSDIFLAPSVTAHDGDQEGIPVAVMEAMAAGLPVVSSQHTGIPELVQDGVSGYLVPERDVEQLAARMAELTGSTSLRQRIAQAARARVCSEFDIDRLNDDLVSLLRRLATSAAPGLGSSDA